MLKLFLLFCSIFGCQATDFLSRSLDRNGTTCTGIGRLPNPLDLGCESYILCLADETGEFVSELVECPEGMIFNATRGRCGKGITNFICPHICEVVEKIPYRKIDCQHYVVCERDVDNGKLTAELRQCPNGTWFCGEFRQCLPGLPDACVRNTSLPPSNWTTEVPTTLSPNTTLDGNETTEAQTTTVSLNTTVTGNETTWQTTTLSPNTTVVGNETTEAVTSTTNNPLTNTTTVTTPSTTPPDELQFTCNEVGRFPLTGICNQYILCLPGDNGDWVMSLEKCPTGRVFSPTRARCIIV